MSRAQHHGTLSTGRRRVRKPPNVTSVASFGPSAWERICQKEQPDVGLSVENPSDDAGLRRYRPNNTGGFMLRGVLLDQFFTDDASMSTVRCCNGKVPNSVNAADMTGSVIPTHV
jgi:hypothetical protein